MEISDAQKLLDANPAAGLLARRDIGDIATNLKAQRPDLRASIDAKLAALEKALPGQSAARQLVAIDATRAELGMELIRIEHERQAARASVAQREALDREARRAQRAAEDFRARKTGAALGALQTAVFKINSFSIATLGHVTNEDDLAAAVVEFEALLDSIKGSFAAAVAAYIPQKAA